MSCLPLCPESISWMSSRSSILASLTTPLFSVVRKGHLEAAAWPAGGDGSFGGSLIFCSRSNKRQRPTCKSCAQDEWRNLKREPATDLGLRGCLWPQQLRGAELWRPAPSTRGTCGHNSPARTCCSASGKRRARYSETGIGGSHSLWLFLI